MPAPKPPSGGDEAVHENLIPVTPGGPDETPGGSFENIDIEEDEEEEANQEEEEEEVEAPPDDDDPASPRAQALLDAFDEDANVQATDDSQEHAD